MNKVIHIIDAKIASWLFTFNQIANRLGTLPTAILVALSVWTISIFLYAPPLWVIMTNTHPSRLDDFLAMCANPLERNLYEPILAYRVTTPLIAWIMGIQGYWAVGIQYIALILIFILLFIVIKRRTDNVTAILTCLALSLTHVAIWTNMR